MPKTAPMSAVSNQIRSVTVYVSKPRQRLQIAAQHHEKFEIFKFEFKNQS